MTRYLTEHNVESKFVNGLRVTSPEVVDAVLKVFAGTVNHLLVSSLVSQGADAVGLSGIDACLTEAVQLIEKNLQKSPRRGPKSDTPDSPDAEEAAA